MFTNNDVIIVYLLNLEGSYIFVRHEERVTFIRKSGTSTNNLFAVHFGSV